jgi:hypothetical protein
MEGWKSTTRYKHLLAWNPLQGEDRAMTLSKTQLHMASLSVAMRLLQRRYWRLLKLSDQQWKVKRCYTAQSCIGTASPCPWKVQTTAAYRATEPACRLHSMVMNHLNGWLVLVALEVRVPAVASAESGARSMRSLALAILPDLATCRG